MKQYILKRNGIANPTKWGITGKETRAIDVYLTNIASHVNSKLIESKHLKVVLDLGNGAQAVATPKFCQMMQCKTFCINENIDGNFPGRGSEPTPQNLSDLSNAVLENNADVGIAFDGDGDRSIFCDNKGNILTGDKSALILSQHILKKNPNSLIVTCMNSGSSIENLEYLVNLILKSLEPKWVV